jgi:hypothetical protein
MAIDLRPAPSPSDSVHNSTDIIHFRPRNLAPDRAFDEVAQHCGVFDTRSGFGTNMKNELAAVGIWEKVLAKPWYERGSRKTDQ